MENRSLCRDCLKEFEGGTRCPDCGSPRFLRHAELFDLSIAHIDCDAFYASVEKRDDPSLVDKPVIIGGGRRGVVSTCCYVARIRGVHSAMPMFQANKLCPDAVVISPRMSRYVEVSQQIKAMFGELTPAVEPLSLDEAFLDLTGTARLHGGAPVLQLAALQRRIQKEIGVTVSVGLSHNKFLAKIASDLDKPRGFSVIGQAETLDFLASRPINIIWGVGPSATKSLQKSGIQTIADLRRRDRRDLIKSFGTLGDRLWHLSHGEDHRAVSARRPVKSITNENTFFEDISEPADLEWHLWNLCEQVSARAKARNLSGQVILLKLKTHDHRIISRRMTVQSPTRMAEKIFRVTQALLHRNIDLGPFRLIGTGLSDLVETLEPEVGDDLLDPTSGNRMGAENAADQIRARFGKKAIIFGRSIRQIGNQPHLLQKK